MSTSPAVMSAAALDAVKAAGLLKSEGLIGGKWVGADSGKTLQVLLEAGANDNTEGQKVAKSGRNSFRQKQCCRLLWCACVCECVVGRGNGLDIIKRKISKRISRKRKRKMSPG